MGLRVATNVPALIAQRNLHETGKQLQKSVARLSSGERIVSAGDDAGGLAISANLEAEIRGMKQAQRNANDGISFAQTAEGALNEVSNILIRLRELAVQAASDTIGDEERTFINKEHEILKTEIDRIANVTTFNGKQLLNGTGGELVFQVGAHANENNVIRFRSENANATTNELGIAGTDVLSKDDAADSLASMDQAISKVNLYRAELGATQTRLHSTSNNLGVHIENLSEARSRVADTDIAEESANLAKAQILQNAGVAVLAQANTVPNIALKLL